MTSNEISSLNLEAMLGVIPEKIFVVSPEGVFLKSYGNSDAPGEYDDSSLINKHYYEVFKAEPTYADEFQSIIHQAIKTGLPQELTYLYDPRIIRRPDQPDSITTDTAQCYEGFVQVLPQKIQGEPAVVWVSKHIDSDEYEANQRQRQLTELDNTTNILSNEAFTLNVEVLFQKRNISTTCYSVMLLSIDSFEKISETYGNLAEEKVLKHIAEVLTLQTRDSDYVGRIDNGDFAICLANIGSKQALSITQRILSAVNRSVVTFNNTDISFTLSAGVSYMKLDDTCVTQAFQRANKALHVSRNTGGDTAYIYSDSIQKL